MVCPVCEGKDLTEIRREMFRIPDDRFDVLVSCEGCGSEFWQIYTVTKTMVRRRDEPCNGKISVMGERPN